MRNRPLYAFDAEEDAMQRWHAVSSQVAEELRTGYITALFRVNGDARIDQVT
jgi:salicylate hydroxylase